MVLILGGRSRYAENIEANDLGNWKFIYGDKFEIHDLAKKYLNVAEEDLNAPGGFNHSGYITLVDSDGYVRSYASGVDPIEVDFLMNDIRLLLK